MITVSLRDMGRGSIAISLVIILLSPLAGSIAAPGMDESESLDRAEDVQRIESGHMDSVPLKALFGGIMMPIGGTIPPWTETRMGFMTRYNLQKEP